MKRVLSVILFIGLLGCLSACGKKETTVETSSDFGELQESTMESTEDEFAITNKDVPGYEVRETTPKEEREKLRESYAAEVHAEYEKESAAILESESVEQSEREVVVNEENVDVTVLEDDYYLKLTEKISNKQYDSLEDVYRDIDNNYSEYDSNVKEKVKELAKDNWEYWEQQYTKIENQKSPWTEEELAQNPNLAYYTREEYEEIIKKLEEMGVVIN